jgi:hypothetical protein
VIVRIMGHGQFRLDDGVLERLNELDNDVASSVGRGDDGAFRRAFEAMIDFVERQGAPLADDELVPSDHVLPSPDTTLEEAREAFADGGVIPG